MPRKNAKVLGGKPLLAWTTEAALSTPEIDRVVLSTEDDEIASLGLGLGVEVPFARPAAIAADTTPMIDVVMHALAWADDAGEAFDALCLLQPTNPSRTVQDISGAISLLVDSGADTVFTTLEVPTEHHPYWAFVADRDGHLHLAGGGTEPAGRRQDLPLAFHREGSVYVTRTATLRSRRSLYGDHVEGYPIPADRSVNIDTPEDWSRAERLLGDAR